MVIAVPEQDLPPGHALVLDLREAAFIAVAGIRAVVTAADHHTMHHNGAIAHVETAQVRADAALTRAWAARRRPRSPGGP